MKLTAAAVERLQPDPARRLEIPDSLLPGLYLVIQPSGPKSWAVRYRFGGRTRKFTLGKAAILNLADARERARDALKLVAAGRDPAVERANARSKDADLVANVVEEFLARHTRLNNKASTAGEVERTFRRRVIPAWGNRQVQTIRRADVIRMLDKLVDDGFPSAAVTTRTRLSKFFNWCVERGLIETSPCSHIGRPAQEVSRDRVLTDDELRLAWLAASKIGWPFGTFAQLLMLTGQRRNEVAGIGRKEIHGTTWTIPGPRTKNGDANEVPLSPVARGIIAAAPRIGKSDLLLTTNGITPISGYSKAKDALDAEMLAIAKQDAGRNDVDEIAIAPWRIHDLRRTLASGLARLGEPIHVIEAILNHTSGTISGVAAIYNRHKYLDEKRAALDRWATYVTGLAE